MNHWRTIPALVACLALLAAGAALADERSKTVTVSSCSDDDEAKELKVEVVREDGEAHVKVWKLEDGEEILIKEYDADEDDERVIDIDGEHVFIVGGDDEDCHMRFFDGDDLKDLTLTGARDKHLKWFEDGGAYLGVQLSGLSDDQAEYFDVKDGDGVLVTEVVEDSPAEAAGFEIYDVILEIDGESVEDPGAVVDIVSDHEEGDEIKVVVRRKGKNKTLEATLDEREGHTFAYYLDDEHHDILKQMHGADGKLRRTWQAKPLRIQPGADREELENLRADIEELRAMLDELKAEKDK